MSTRALACLLVVVATRAPLQAQEGSPSGARVTGQVTAGMLATPLGFVGGGLATRWLAYKFGSSDARAEGAAYVGAWTSATLAAATAPALIARGGAWPQAVGGAVAGGVVAAGFVWLGRRVYRPRPRCSIPCTLLGATVFALPASGATWAYNHSR